MNKVYIAFHDPATDKNFMYPLDAEKFLELQSKHGPRLTKEILDGYGYHGYENFPFHQW